MYSKISALLFPLLAVAGPVRRQSGSTIDPNQISIVSQQYSGSGCPQGSASINLTPNNQTITFGFDKFQAQLGPGLQPGLHTSNCQLHLELHYPGGFQYTMVQSTFHGFAQLDPDVYGEFLTQYFFSEAPGDTAEGNITISTATDPKLEGGDFYTKVDVINTTSVVWSPCGETGIFNADNVINLKSYSKDSNAQGSISDYDATVQLTQEILVQWQTCDPSTSSRRDVEYPPAEFGFGTESLDSFVTD